MIVSRTNGYGCPYCRNKLACKGGCLAAKYPKIARLAIKEEGDDVDVHLITDNGEITYEEVDQHLAEVQDNLNNTDINFTYEIASDQKLHASSITTDTD